MSFDGKEICLHPFSKVKVHQHFKIMVIITCIWKMHHSSQSLVLHLLHMIMHQELKVLYIHHPLQLTC
jgi:hypothetical protein